MCEKIDESAAHDLKTWKNIAQEHIGFDLDTESRLWRRHRGVNDISLCIVIQSKHRFHIHVFTVPLFSGTCKVMIRRETGFHHAIAVARRQQTQSWELRAAGR